VTVVHPRATWADAAATALLAAGPVRWQGLARRLGLDQVLVQHVDGGVEVTATLAARLRWLQADAAQGHRVV
jgi:thiamine biosynthesis lipoprotein